jgi:hypothetical protein
MATTGNTTETNWSFNTDIYDITDTLNGLKKRYIEDQNETTLALGVFGYITDTEAKKIQTSTVMIGQLGNEMFPSRAKLTKNVIAHAIYNNISDINAVPATITINIGIKTEDLEIYMKSGKFTIDCECPIFISDYEFHFDYDIILQRTLNSSGEYSYSAHYDMSSINRLSDITEPYLVQPFTIRIGNFYYVVFQAKIRQYTIEETTDKIISNSIIENKTYTFEFENQIADFDVYVSDNGGEERRIRPYIYGTDEVEETDYCWYLFISDNTIRISFDSTSYVPGLNTNIRIRAYTTLGSEGNFTYKAIDESESGMYVDMNSDKYGYNTITCYMVAVTNSINGTNKKTKSELQKLIPKMAHSRGSITTEEDVLNYFNLIDSSTNRIVVRKKVDNQISRVWYAYFVLKDSSTNLIPTNTINLLLDTSDGSMILAEDGRYILPAGTVICMDKKDGYCKVIDAADVPELYSDEYFNGKYYYMTIYNTLLSIDPLYAAYYMTISNKDQYFKFYWVNEESILQFVANKCNFSRSLLTDQSSYKLNFSIAQSIASDYGMYEVNEETGEVTNNMVCVVVLYKDGAPYRWQPCTLTSYDTVNYVASWELNLTTDNGFDTKNDIKINSLHVAGYSKDINYGYFEPNTKAILYILGKFDSEYGRYDLDIVCPDVYTGYTVTNIYEINGGLNFYTNYTNVLNTRVDPLVENDTITNGKYMFYGIPVVGMHYVSDEVSVNYFIDALTEKKEYIDDCLDLLENNMDIDFKFFNTYGPSKIYCIGDEAETLIGHIDISINFKVSIKSTTDIYTKDDIIAFIKNYIENIDEIGDLHIPNLITDITNEYSDRINYIEYINFNDFGLGVQHIQEIENASTDAIPEFLNIRNHYNDAGRLVPCINLEVVY